MNKILLLSILLLASLSWAWIEQPPSCLSSYELLGVNFIAGNNATGIPCLHDGVYYQVNPTDLAINNPFPPINETIQYLGSTPQLAKFTFSSNSSSSAVSTLTGLGLPANVSVNYSINVTTPGTSNNKVYNIITSHGTLAFSNSGNWSGNCNFTTLNTTHTNISCSGTGLGALRWVNISNFERYNISWYTDGVNAASITFGTIRFSVVRFNDTSSGNMTGFMPFGYTSNFSSNGINYFVMSDGLGFNKYTTAIITQGLYFRALIYYQSIQLFPDIVYTPGLNATPYFWNSTDGTTFLRNNTLTYIHDIATNTWYIVPALSVSDLNLVYSISSLLSSAGSSNGTATVPLIATYKSCLDIGDQYIVNTTYSQTATHLLTAWNATNAVVNTSVGSAFLQYTNTSIYPNVNYTVNGYPVCLRTNSSQFLPLSAVGINDVGGAIFIYQIIMVAAAAIGMFSPIGLFFMVGFNDVFQLFPAPVMAILVGILGVLSTIVQGWDRTGMKQLIVLAILIVGVLTPLYNYASMDPTLLNSTMARIIPVTAGANPDFTQFVTNPTFIINLLKLMATLPLVITQAIATPLATVSPLLASGLIAFGNLITIAGYAYIAIRAYEVLGKVFPGVV